MPFAHIRFPSLALAALATAVAAAPARADGPLRYQFKAGEELVYELTITTDLPGGTETVAGHLYLTVKSVDAVNGQVVLTSRDRVKRQYTNVPVGQFPPIGPGLFGGGFDTYGELTVDARGQQLGSKGGLQVGYLQGLLTKLTVEPLPEAAGQADWQEQRPVVVQEVYGRQFGIGAFNGQAHDDHSATEVDTYHLTGPAAADGAVTVRKTYTMTAAEKVGDQPILRQAGEATFVFDAAAGRVRSLDQKQTITVHARNTTTEVPTTLTAKLLEGEAARVAIAADQEADAKQAADNRKWQDDHRSDASVRPDQRSALVGGNGGGEFTMAGDGSAPLIGIRYTLGDWGGNGCLRHVGTVYNRADVKPGTETETIRVHGRERTVSEKVLLAKDGYAIGALKVWADRTNAVAMQVTFYRLREGKLVTADKYTSETVGFPGDARGGGKLLGGDGRPVIGLCGHQGLNLDALGVVQSPKDGATEKGDNGGGNDDEKK